MNKQLFLAWIGIIAIVLLIALGCQPKPWPDSVLPNADSRAVISDEALEQADADSKFRR